MAKVLIVVGSLRERSFNRQLARLVEDCIGARAEVSVLDWEDVPVFNQDRENPVQAPVARVREEVLAADGLWFCTPEYNGNVPGGEKNLLDWLSRPRDPEDRMSPSVVKGKLAAISGVGGKRATGAVRDKLAELLEAMGMELVGDEGVGFAVQPEAWTTDVLELSDEQLEELGELVDEFVEALA